MKKLPAKKKPLALEVLIRFMTEWLSRSRYYCYAEKAFNKNDLRSHAMSVSQDRGEVRVHLYTHDRIYHIVAKTNGYLGAACTNRRAEPGENWMRGRDFPDGPFNEVTWNKIISAIAFREIEYIEPVIKDVLEGKDSLDKKNPEKP